MDQRDNSGNFNIGDRNSGNRNSGNFNSGDFNSGNCNSGSCNSGGCNSGNFNSGNRNSGNRNSGSCNSGSCNSGNFNSGFFCTETPPVMFFDRPSSLTHAQALNVIPFIDLPIGTTWVESDAMTADEKSSNPQHTTIGGFLRAHNLPIRQAFPQAWAKLSNEERAKWLSLPNFDAEKFLAITGVDVRKTAKVRLPNGTVAELPVVE